MNGVTGGTLPHTSGTGSSSLFLKTLQCLNLLIIVLQPFQQSGKKKGQRAGFCGGGGGNIEYLKTLCTQVFLGGNYWGFFWGGCFIQGFTVHMWDVIPATAFKGKIFFWGFCPDISCYVVVMVKSGYFFCVPFQCVLFSFCLGNYFSHLCDDISR